jgi:hypothetical protein
LAKYIIGVNSPWCGSLRPLASAAVGHDAVIQAHAATAHADSDRFFHLRRLSYEAVQFSELLLRQIFPTLAERLVGVRVE